MQLNDEVEVRVKEERIDDQNEETLDPLADIDPSQTKIKKEPEPDDAFGRRRTFKDCKTFRYS